MLTLPLEAIDKQEALRYMGCPAEPDETLRTVVDTCEQQLRRTVQPRVVYRVLPLYREAGTLSAGIWRNATACSSWRQPSPDRRIS